MCVKYGVRLSVGIRCVLHKSNFHLYDMCFAEVIKRGKAPLQLGIKEGKEVILHYLRFFLL